MLTYRDKRLVEICWKGGKYKNTGSPCVINMSWCSFLADSSSASSFSLASLMFFSTSCLCCLSNSWSAFQRDTYSNSNVPGWEKCGFCSLSLEKGEIREDTNLHENKHRCEIDAYLKYFGIFGTSFSGIPSSSSKCSKGSTMAGQGVLE